MLLRRQYHLFLLAGMFAVAGIVTVRPAVAAGDAEFGQYLSSQCTTCHQLSGKTDGIPAIVGWDEETFIAVMQAYRSKELANPAMQNIAGTLSDEDMAALAAYFATIKPSAN